MQISTTKRRSKAKPQGEGELSKLDNSAKRAADMLGIHLFSLHVLTAFGVGLSRADRFLVARVASDRISKTIRSAS